MPLKWYVSIYYAGFYYFPKIDVIVNIYADFCKRFFEAIFVILLSYEACWHNSNLYNKGSLWNAIWLIVFVCCRTIETVLLYKKAYFIYWMWYMRRKSWLFLYAYSHNVPSFKTLLYLCMKTIWKRSYVGKTFAWTFFSTKKGKWSYKMHCQQD